MPWNGRAFDSMPKPAEVYFPFVPHPDKWKHQVDSATCMCRCLSGWGKTLLAHPFPTLTSESINLVQMVIGVGKNWAGPFVPHPDKLKHQPCADGYQLTSRWGKTKAGPFIPHHMTSESINLVQIVTGVGKNWAGPFFPHPDKLKHQPCADGYRGGEKPGRPILSPPS